MNIKSYRRDIIPGWLVVQAARFALDNPPRVSFLDRAIMITVIIGGAMLTVQVLIWVLR